MGVLLDREAVVRADREMFELGVDGIAEGCAREVGHVLGKLPPMKKSPDYEVRRPGFVLRTRKSGIPSISARGPVGTPEEPTE
jgi:hypothetical protein